MKLISHDEVLKGGYVFPSEGLCFNMDNLEAEAFRSEGEWILSNNEQLASEGGSQNYLYMLMSGQVDLLKADHFGENQKLSILTVGDTFGEVAFLKGRISSVTATSVGTCLLWRMDYTRLLKFIVEHGTSGGQLCLNLAGILAGRLVDGNQRVMEIRDELQQSIKQMQSARSEGVFKTRSLEAMQSQLVSMEHGFRSSGKGKSVFSIFSIVCLAMAFLSTAGLIILLSADEDITKETVDQLNKKLVQLEQDQTFQIDLKKKLESENLYLVNQADGLIEEKILSEENAAQLEEELTKSRAEIGILKNKLDQSNDQFIRSQSDPIVVDENVISDEFIMNVLEWVKENPTVVLPVAVKIINNPIVLSDREQLVQIPIQPGGEVVAIRLHTEFDGFLVVGQKSSQQFLASVKIENTNFIEVVGGKYIAEKKRQGESVQNPILKPLE